MPDGGNRTFKSVAGQDMATSIHDSVRPRSPEGTIDPCAMVEAKVTTNLFSHAQPEPLVLPAAAAVPPWTESGPGAADAGHRLFDILLSTAMLVSLSPLMLLTALLIKAGGRGPVIFRHSRIGRDGKPFVCLKFRTMENSAEDMLPDLLGACDAIRSEWKRDHKIRSDPRVTRVGQILRRFSVDELPQLINVLRGDMSIVGPRPIVAAEIERYAQHFPVYCSVKPGLTGLWQVSGRNRVSYERRVELDCQYARSKSIARDTWIILRTIPVVMQGNGF